MTLLSFAQWLQSTDLFTAVRGSWYFYPIVMTCHLAAIALFGGMILVVNLRLLGVAMRHRPASELVEEFRTPKRVGFVILAICGILMAGSKAEEYYYNAFFLAKMTLLALVGVHGLVFRSVYHNTAELDRAESMPVKAKVAALLSLILWTGLVIAGRGIGYIEPPLDKIHAQLANPPAAVGQRP